MRLPIQLIALLLCSITASAQNWSQSACCLDTLTINTGYDPTSGLDLPSGLDGGTPVVDPKWIVTYISPSADTAIAAMGYTAVAIGGNANVVSRSSTWVINPTSNPGNWISCLNGNGYNTPGAYGTPIYFATLGRPFTLCMADSINLDLYIAGDNYITTLDIDSTITLPFSQPVGDIHPNYNSSTHFTQTVWLGAGTHIMHVTVQNYTSSIPGNGMGIDIYGVLRSGLDNHSIKSENPDCDTLTTNDLSVSEVSSYLRIFPNPTSSKLTISSSEKISTVVVKNIIGQVVYNGHFDAKSISLDVANLPSGVYTILVNQNHFTKFVKD